MCSPRVMCEYYTVRKLAQLTTRATLVKMSEESGIETDHGGHSQVRSVFSVNTLCQVKLINLR